MCDCVSLYDILAFSLRRLRLRLQFRLLHLQVQLLPISRPLFRLHDQGSLPSGDRYGGYDTDQQMGAKRGVAAATGWSVGGRHLLSQRILRANDAIAVTCSPTPWGNISRLFGKSTACFILACNFRWVFLWQKGDKSQNQLEINVALVCTSLRAPLWLQK